MPDNRTKLERTLWKLIGPPLYYCSECLKAVDVKIVTGAEPIIKRPCQCNAQIFAPRKSIVAGVGGLSFPNKVRMVYWQISAALTGRSV